jgi:branched-subunit amino acid transport protein AzlD
MNRLIAALIAYAVLGVLTWLTISDVRIRAVPLGILLLFAVLSILRRREVMHPDGEHDADRAEELKAKS